MALYDYIALTASGEEVHGVLQGPSPAWVGTHLRQRQLVPLEVTPARPREGSLAQLRRHLPVTPDDLALLSSQCAVMLEAGVPIVAALELLADNNSKVRLRNGLQQAVGVVRDGGSLHEGLTQSRLFPGVYLDMIRAAETGGTLARTMKQLATYLDRECEMRGKLQKALAYPAFLVVLSLGVVTFLLVAIIPRFTHILANLGVQLPWPTRALIALSKVVTRGWPLLLLLAVGGIAAVAWAVRDPRARARLDAALLRLPLLGELVAKNALARMTYVLSSLLSAGIPLAEAMAVSASTAGNRSLAAALARARREILTGASISEALATTGAFPPLVIQMVVIGESAGNLDMVLARVCDLYDQQVDRVMRTVVSLVEPSLIVVLGGVVGFIALSLVLPMVKAVSAIGG
jgi:type II secretory pathway component PulF